MRIDEVDKPISQLELDQLEAFADRLFGKVGIDVEFTRHFLDRVNDERNVRQITASELTRLFKQEYKRYGKPIAQLGPDAEAVMKDMQTDINMPFVLRWDPANKELDLIAKTVMRKKDFRTSNPEFRVESQTTALGGRAEPGVGQPTLAMLQESGSAPGVGPIHISEIQPTLVPLSKELGVDLYQQALGSVGKKQFSGDIDVAINIPPEELDAFAEKLKANPKILYFERTSVFITKIKIEGYNKNLTYKDPQTGEDKGVPKGRTGFVQLDFMPGDPGWLKTYYHSPDEKESKYKGVYRNILLSTIAAVYDRKDSQETIPDGRPVESERYMWSGKDGLVRIKRTPAVRKDGQGYTKANKNVIVGNGTKNPEEIAKRLGLDSAADLNSFESLLDAIKKNYGPKDVQQIVTGFIDNSVVKDIGVPSELQ